MDPEGSGKTDGIGKIKSLGYEERQSSGQVWLFIAEAPIPTISGKPVKSLGHIYNSSQEKFNSWIYQHSILLRILWPLLLYEFLISTISVLERRISCYLRRWLGLPRNLSSITLYGNTCKLRLPTLNPSWFCMRGKCYSSESPAALKTLGQGWQLRLAGSGEQRLQ